MGHHRQNGDVGHRRKRFLSVRDCGRAYERRRKIDRAGAHWRAHERKQQKDAKSQRLEVLI